MSIRFEQEGRTIWAFVGSNPPIGYYFKKRSGWMAVHFVSVHDRNRWHDLGTEAEAQQWLVEQIEATAK